MKLFVLDDDGNKIYIEKNATTKKDLKDTLGSSNFRIDNKTYRVNDVRAERDPENTPISMVVGGAIGLVGGVPGVILGGLAGGLLGKNSDVKEENLVNKFNESELNG